MPSLIFFKIGNTDLTPNLDYQNYQMNKDSVYETWKDGNGVDHRVQYRTRISGEFHMGFLTDAALASFQALLASSITADGYYSVTGYINNTGASETFDAYIDTSDVSKWDLVNGRRWHDVTVRVIER